MFKSSFLPPNDYERQWRKYTRSLHKRRLNHARPAIDTRSPQQFSHIQYKAKKEQLQEERFTEIERENRILLEKMHCIMNRRLPAPRFNSTVQRRPQTIRQRKKPTLRQTQYLRDTKEHWLRPLTSRQLVARKFARLRNEEFLVEVFTESSQIVVQVSQTNGPASYILEISRTDAAEVLHNSNDYEKLVDLLNFEGNELVLTEQTI